ncbi:hypothetical protein BDN71DRAFT_1187507 [Pleurotus eryngii]|uniref:F-box domain-containing protein n=1 Tax=Pleurotus eryngii TaxID=5323 RepID=A0A9P6A8I9_PLEER|nr:hypothetical protein BDN71DRAFT_1187507 [Pleurotus eryngii]
MAGPRRDTPYTSAILEVPRLPSLPTELWTRIFIECQPTDEYPLLHRTMLTTAIIYVSKEWRAMALGCGALWASFEIVVDEYPRAGRHEELQRRLSLWLQRSRSYPLIIALRYTPKTLSSSSISGQRGEQISAVVGLLAMLLKHKHRFRSLRLRLPSGCLSALQALQNGPLNLLGSLDIETVGTDVSPPLDLASIYVNWTRFTTLRLDIYPRIPVDDCYRVLSRATSMETCVMTVDGSHMPRVEPYAPVTLGNLQTLQLRFTNSSSLGFSGYSFAGLLDSLHLPRIANLDVACLFDYDSYSESNFLRELKSLLLRSSQSLKTLSLTNAQYNDQELLSILHETPRISDLSLKFPLRAGEDPVSEEFIRAFISASKGQPLCPHLANFRLQCHGTRFTEASLVKMISSRISQTGGVEALRSFDLFSARAATTLLTTASAAWIDNGFRLTTSSMTIL